MLCEWLTSEVQLAFTQCFIDRHNNNDKKATQRYKKQLPLQCRWSAGEVFDTETNYKPTNIEGTSLRRWTYRNHSEDDDDDDGYDECAIHCMSHFPLA